MELENQSAKGCCDRTCLYVRLVLELCHISVSWHGWFLYYVKASAGEEHI